MASHFSRPNRTFGQFGFFAEIVPTLFPIGPFSGPLITRQFFAGFGPDLIHALDLAQRAVIVTRCQFRLDEIKVVFGILGKKLQGFLQMLAGPGFAADADWPTRGLEIKQTEVPVRACKIKLRIEAEGEFEFGFYLPDDMQGLQTLAGIGELA